MAKSDPMANPEDLIPSVEATELLGVGRSTLTRWVQSGRLPEARKLPGKTGVRLFHRSDIERLRDEIEAERLSPAAGKAS